MKTFKDGEGRSWNIVIHVGTVKAVEDATGVKLLEMFGDTKNELFGDAWKFVQTLWVLVQKQAKAIDVMEDSFFISMTGDSLNDAADALAESVIDFFPSSRRTVLRAMTAKAKQMSEQIEAKALEQIDQISLESLQTATKSQA